MSRSYSLAWLGLLALACGPNPQAPVKVMALIREAGAFKPTQVELTTVTDITALKGPMVTFVGSTRVAIRADDPLQAGIVDMSDDQRYDVIVKDKGGDVRGHYVEKDGVLWPADFHTWNMVSTYYSFEKAYLYFNSLYDERGATELWPFRVHYWSDVELNSAEPLTDNMLYLSFIKSFVVAPFKREQKIPLSMNVGVVGHEVAHRVFSVKTFEDEGLPQVLRTWNLQPFNLLKSLDEGLADFHGYSVTRLERDGDLPNFLTLSVSDARTVEARDVSRPKACMDESLRSAFQNASQLEWVTSSNMYTVGNLIAASLFWAGNAESKLTELQRAVVATYDDESPLTPGFRQLIRNNLNTSSKFTPELVVDAIAAHIGDQELRKRVCSEFSTRMQLRCGSWPCLIDGQVAMPHCDATAAGRDNSVCPAIPQP